MTSRSATTIVPPAYLLAAIPTGATNIVAVAAGDGHILALRSDGTVFGWGQNNYGQANVPPDITYAVRISAGSTHSIALLDDGTIRFWGDIYSTGVTNPPPVAISNMVELAIGATAQHVLSIRSDGRVAEWGNTGYGLTNVPSSVTNVIAAAVASYNSLVLRSDGTAVNWGKHFSTLTVAPPPASATNGIGVATGFADDVVLRADGNLVVWQTSSPLAVPPEATNIINVACGAGQVLALRADDLPVLWQSMPPTNSAPATWTNVVEIAAMTSFNVVVIADDGPPLLGRMLQPTVAAGATARIRALAISTTPVTYQWSYNGTNIPTGTNATLVLTNIQPAQAGVYTLVVSNAFGSVTNNNINVGVAPFLFQLAPQDQTVSGGATATFSTVLLGQAPFSYQWQFNGTNLPGATKSSLSLTNVEFSNAGPYNVVVTNNSGSLTSAVATLTVVPLFITGQPTSQTSYLGGQGTFSVGASGKGPFSYQWQFYGSNILSATTNPLVVPNLQFSNSGPYSVTVTNSYGSVLSSNAILTVVPILLNAQPQSQVGFHGQTIRFTVAAQAGQPLSYQWQFNGTDIPGATSSTLTLTNCQFNQSGIYHAYLSDGPDNTNTVEATLAITPVASWGFFGQSAVPTNLSNVIAVAAGGTHSLALKADGTVVRWADGYHPPPELTNVMTISAGGIDDIALKADGTVTGWGVNNSGDLNVPPNVSNPLAVTIGGYHVLALNHDRTITAWGNNSYGQTNVPPQATNIIAVAAGDYHSLALSGDGNVFAWGQGTSAQTNVPSGLSNVVAIAGGANHSMALKADGNVVVWGDSADGVTSIAPGATNVVAIAGGAGFCLALRDDGTVVGWGYNSSGQTIAPADLRNVIGLAAGSYHGIALIADETIGPRAALSEPGWGTNGFQVSIPTRSGRVYRLEYETSLSDNNWVGLPLIPGTGAITVLTDPATPGSQRFYRVRQW